MKTLILAAIRCSLMFTAVTASLFSVRPAQAFTVTLKQVGSNVVVTGSGAINLTGLTFVSGGFARHRVNGPEHCAFGRCRRKWSKSVYGLFRTIKFWAGNHHHQC